MIPERVLFLSPSFFGYEGDIENAFVRQGSEVDYFDERPSNASWAKAILRFGRPVLNRSIRVHFEGILRTIVGRRYNLVLVVKGEVVPDWFLAQLRSVQPGARFVFYTFDAIKNSPNCVQLFPYFDRLYSFDFEDVRRYEELELKHLFYALDFTPGPVHEIRKFDASFVGTLHSDRFAFVGHVFAGLQNTYRFFYVQAAWLFYVRRVFSSRFRQVQRTDVSFEKLNRSEVASIFRQSRSVLDMQREGQSGLTMRTFEVLASGSTLVTSNPFVAEMDFFDPERVVVLPASGPQDVELFRRQIASLAGDGQMPPGFEIHSVNAWVSGFNDPRLVESTEEIDEDRS
ncbi:glycosyltransferase family 1 protein [Cryobacterium algoritolerans]|uniref:Glycosyltransferase family 1 protein n=1 Tax=Cryobacterium algoritolerans TaxID=1259184 RepID=A0A4R8WR13_9MICO|nr:glycosyltransferase [Cryobacterium algoritolerans]TFC12022.1 glycosyltransferase family 1 protein [Cryobacterium algoritolerans]